MCSFRYFYTNFSIEEPLEDGDEGLDPWGSLHYRELGNGARKFLLAVLDHVIDCSLPIKISHTRMDTS